MAAIFNDDILVDVDSDRLVYPNLTSAEINISYPILVPAPPPPPLSSSILDLVEECEVHEKSRVNRYSFNIEREILARAKERENTKPAEYQNEIRSQREDVAYFCGDNSFDLLTSQRKSSLTDVRINNVDKVICKDRELYFNGTSRAMPKRSVSQRAKLAAKARGEEGISQESDHADVLIMKVITTDHESITAVSAENKEVDAEGTESMSATWEARARELDGLVKAGEWESMVLAASQFENNPHVIDDLPDDVRESVLTGIACLQGSRALKAIREDVGIDVEDEAKRDLEAQAKAWNSNTYKNKTEGEVNVVAGTENISWEQQRLDKEAKSKANNNTTKGGVAATLKSIKRKSKKGQTKLKSLFNSQPAQNEAEKELPMSKEEELAAAIEAGDWSGAGSIAAVFADVDALEKSTRSSTSSSGESTKFFSARSPRQKEEIREEVETLVRRIVPEEIGNVDKMMLQFEGREEHLIGTLRTMEERSAS